MYIRAQSPESSNCCGSLAPLAPLISSPNSPSPRSHDGSGHKSPSPPSPLYSSVSSAALVGTPPEGTNANNNNYLSSHHRGGDVSAPLLLHRVESDEYLFLQGVKRKCRSILTSNCSSDNSIYDHLIEDEDRIVNFVSPCKSALDVEGCAELAQTCSSSPHQLHHQQQQADSTSVLQHKWSTSSSSDSLKSVNQDDDNEERRERDRDKFDNKKSSAPFSEGALFYRSYGAHQQQQPGSSSIVGLHRKWSDSSCSLDSIDQEEDDKNTAHGFPGSHQNNQNNHKHADNHHHHHNNENGNGTVRLKGLTGSLGKKWSSSNCSLDSIDNEEEEDDFEIRSQFPPLVECVRVIDPPPMLQHHRRDEKQGPVLSSSSSSIGNRSEGSSGSVVSDLDSPGDMEVESTLRTGHHSQLNLSSLESSLPIKRGLSRFWNGKAKSFASLQDVSSLASLADLAKPENPYNKRRRFSSGFGIRPSSPLSRPHTAGISKKPPSGTGKSCLAIAVAMGNKLENGPKCLSPQSALRNAQRSFSLSDLGQHGSNSADHHAPPATMTRMRRS